LDVPPVSFQIAVGDYDEVLEWYNKGLIDVAVLAASPLEELLMQAGSYDKQQIMNSYLGTVERDYEYQPTSGPDSSPGCPTAPPMPDPHYYESIAVVNKLSGYNSFEDLKWDSGRAKFWFVRPYSLSGYLLPKAFLTAAEIPSKDTFVYQHDTALDRLNAMTGKEPKPEDVKHIVFFTYKRAKLPCNLRVLSSDSSVSRSVRLSTPIPMDSVLVNTQLPDEDRRARIFSMMRRILRIPKMHNKSTIHIATDLRKEEWLAGFEALPPAVAGVALPGPSNRRARVSVCQIMEDLEKYKNGGLAPRLAVVFSGGGAKCAYQVGVIEEIEERFARGLSACRPPSPRPENGPPFTPTIDLVVGTSGGAINALQTAMKWSSAPSKPMETFWIGLDQSAILSPSWRLRLEMGLGLALLGVCACIILSLVLIRPVRRDVVALIVLSLVVQTALLVYLTLYLSLFYLLLLEFFVAVLIGALILSPAIRPANRPLKNHLRSAGRAMVWLAILEMLVLILGWSIGQFGRHSGVQWSFLDRTSSSAQHLWAACNIFAWWSVPFLFAIGLICIKVHRLSTVRMSILATLGIIMFAVGLLLVGSVLWREQSISSSKGMKRAAVSTFPALLRTLQKFNPSIRQQETLADLSEAIVTDGLLKRDLIITVSQTSLIDSPTIPEDLYFYYRASCPSQGTTNAVPLDRRFISFDLNKDKLLPVALGSGTIFPFFPAQPLKGVVLGRGGYCENAKDAGEAQQKPIDLTVVDGGFIHNKPIGAAISWKATHVILINASGTKPSKPPTTFKANSEFAFDYLYEQAQRADTATEGAAQVYELRPSSECLRANGFHCTGEQLLPDPDLDVFDFSQSLMRRAIEAGKRDVTSEVPLFTRIPGPPVFLSATVQ